MRCKQIFRRLLGGLLLGYSISASARGGPGGALAYLLGWLLSIAILGGLGLGSLCGVIFRRTVISTVVMATLLTLALGVACLRIDCLFVLMFFGLPAMVSTVVFAIMSDFVKTDLLQTRIKNNRPLSSGSTIQKYGQRTVRQIIQWIGGSYVFWASVSLLNIQLLGFLAVPFLSDWHADTIRKFLPFIRLPLIVGISFGVGITLIYFILIKTVRLSYMHSLVFNVAVLIAFLISAEMYKNHLMTKALRGHQPNKYQSSSFLGSILDYDPYSRWAHASFNEDGKTFIWSYSERNFIQVLKMQSQSAR